MLYSMAGEHVYINSWERLSLLIFKLRNVNYMHCKWLIRFLCFQLYQLSYIPGIADCHGNITMYRYEIDVEFLA